jgi:hypothetical protein
MGRLMATSAILYARYPTAPVRVASVVDAAPGKNQSITASLLGLCCHATGGERVIDTAGQQRLGRTANLLDVVRQLPTRGYSQR